MSKKVVKNLLGLKTLTSAYVKSAGLSVNQLVTHLPDEVVYTNHNRSLPYLSKFQGVLMFLDISGFTALCERYSMNVKNGTDELTKTLNAYMGALVQEILDHDGDIYKYAGDAILTMWRVEGFAEMKKGVMHVMRCALNIQKKYSQWNTGVGVRLKVKIGIAAGEVTICFIGNSNFCHYVGCGRAVDAVNKAEKFCESGDIVISPTAFCHLGNSEIEHTVLSDRKHVLLNSDIAMFPNVDYKMQCMIPSSGSCNNLLARALSHKRKGSTESATKDDAPVSKVEKLFSRGSKKKKVPTATLR